MNTSLKDLGWNSIFQFYFDEAQIPNAFPARIVRVDRGLCRLLCQTHNNPNTLLEVRATIHAKTNVMPAVGDWCAISLLHAKEHVAIHSILPRQTTISRKAAGKAISEQVIASNVDVAFLVTDLGDDFSVRRLERLLVLVREGGVRPVIVLNKADLCVNVADLCDQVEMVAPGIPTLVVSAKANTGIHELSAHIAVGQSVVFLGSSGVGKSSLINRLLGKEYLETQEVASDGRGKHTTTHRELMVLPSGGLLIDNPGIREVGLWASGQALADTFFDIAEFAENCKFRNCTHTNEPGCRVQEAVEQNQLPKERLESFHKLQKEIASTQLRANEHERRKAEKHKFVTYRKWAEEDRKLKEGK